MTDRTLVAATLADARRITFTLSGVDAAIVRKTIAKAAEMNHEVVMEATIVFAPVLPPIPHVVPLVQYQMDPETVVEDVVFYDDYMMVDAVMRADEEQPVVAQFFGLPMEAMRAVIAAYDAAETAGPPPLEA